MNDTPSISWSIATIKAAGFSFKRIRGFVMIHRTTSSGTAETHLLTSRQALISIAESLV